MASQVLSGASNPSYTNNTGENVRVVINFMMGSEYIAPIQAVTDRFGRVIRQGTPGVNSNLTINWAGVSMTSSSNSGTIVIGRNLAYSNKIVESIVGGTTRSTVQGPNPNFGQGEGRASQFIITGFTDIATNASIGVAVGSQNSTGTAVALPTELMLAPGQSFSAVCGVHNIVVIPENG